jgi:hypothetical protein
MKGFRHALDGQHELGNRRIPNGTYGGVEVGYSINE